MARKKRGKKKSKQKLTRTIKRLSKDGNINRKDAKKIEKIADRNNLGSKAIQKSISTTVKTRSDNGKETNLGKKASSNLELKINKKGKVKKTSGKKDDGDNGNKGGKGGNKGGKGGGGEDTTPKVGKEIDEDIKESSDSDSKYYQKYDYEKGLKKAAADAKSRDKDARKDYKGPEKMSTPTKRLGKIKDRTGFNKIEGRINSQGKLQDKKGALKAKKPDLEKYKEEISKIKSPYADKIASLGGRDARGYDEASRKKRSRQRLNTLANKLKPKSGSPFGKWKSKKSGYGDAGSDLLNKFSQSKRQDNMRIKRQKDRRKENRQNRKNTDGFKLNWKPIKNPI